MIACASDTSSLTRGPKIHRMCRRTEFLYPTRAALAPVASKPLRVGASCGVLDVFAVAGDDVRPVRRSRAEH